MADLYSIEDHRGVFKPKLDAECYLAPNAQIIGNVEVKKGANIWFGAVLRGDIEPIMVGENSNIQDNSVLHTEKDAACIVKDNVTVGHSVTLHGCTINDGCLIGMGAVILNRSVIGKNCLIGAGALVTEDMIIPDNSLVVGFPAKVIRQLSDKEIEAMHQNTVRYIVNGQNYQKNLKKLNSSLDSQV